MWRHRIELGNREFTFLIACLIGMLGWAIAGDATAQDSVNRSASAGKSTSAAKSGAASDNELTQLRAKAIAFLKASQADDGSFSAQLGPALTAMVADAMMRSGVPVADPTIAKALEYVQKFVHSDGGIYGGSQHENYETSIAIMCFNTANKGGKYDKLIADAVKFEKKIQWDEGEGVAPDDPRYGGQGYGNEKRPDLSNTGMFVDALKEIGTDDDDPALKEALKFISNSQNLNTPYNTTKFAPLVNDGGFYYTPVGEGESKPGKTENGGLRSYGTMTYVGFKSLLYAGLKPDDPRVKAARKWIESHYTLDENPGMGQQGLFYFYHVFGKALSATGEKTLKDADGNESRLASGLDCRAGQASSRGRLVGQPGGRTLVRRRPEPGDGLFIAGVVVLRLTGYVVRRLWPAAPNDRRLPHANYFRKNAATSETKLCTDASAMRWPTIASIARPINPKGGV